MVAAQGRETVRLACDVIEAKDDLERLIAAAENLTKMVEDLKSIVAEHANSIERIYGD